MKKFFFFIFFLLFNTLAYSDSKIAFIDIDYIIKNSKFSLQYLDKYNINKENKINELKKDEAFLKKEEENLLKTKNIITIEEYEKNFQILSDKFNQYNLKRESYIKEINLLRQEEILNVIKKINPLIEKYVNDNKIEILLNKKDIVIAKSEYDITNFIIELLDKNL